MASFSGNGSGTAGGSSYTITLNVNETYTSGGADNYSDVSWNLQLTSKDYNFYDWTIPTYVYVDGEVYNASPKLGINKYSTITIASGSKRIYHNSDGSKSINVNARINATGASFVPGNASCSGTVTLNKIPRYANFTQHYVKSKTLNSVTVYWASDSARDHTQYSLNGGAWTDAGDTGSTSATYTIGGLKPNTKYTIKTRIKRTDSQLWTESGTLTVTTYDIARLTAVNSLTIGNNVTLKYSNPSGNKTEIGLYNTSGGSPVRSYQTVSGGSYAFNFTTAEINNIYSRCSSSLYVDLRFYIRTTQGSSTYTSYITTRFNINQSTNKPIFTDFNFYEDTENQSSPTFALIGNVEGAVIKNKSTTEIVFRHATAQNGASIIRYEIKNGDRTVIHTVNSNARGGSGDGEADYVKAFFSGPTTATFTVTAIDSRGLATSVTKTGTLYDYKNPYIKTLSYTRENGVGDKVFFNLEATYDTIDYPLGENPHTVAFRYKRKSSSTYSDWYDITSYSGLVTDKENSTIKNADTHNFIPNITPNIKVGDNLNGALLKLNFPNYIDYKTTDFYNLSGRTLLKVDDTHYIREVYESDITPLTYSVIVVYPDEINGNEHVIYTINGDYPAWKNEVEFQLPSDFGTITSINSNTIGYQYIRTQDMIDENAYLPFVNGIEYDIEFRVKDTLFEWTKNVLLTSGIPATSKKKKKNGRYSVGINCFPEDDYGLKVLDNMKLDDVDVGKFIARNDGNRTDGNYNANNGYNNGKVQIFSNVLAYCNENTTDYGIMLFMLQDYKPSTTTKFIVKGYIENNNIGTDFEVSFYASSTSISNAKCKIDDTTWVKDIYVGLGNGTYYDGLCIGFVHDFYDSSTYSSNATWTKPTVFIESIYVGFGKMDESYIEGFNCTSINSFYYMGINATKCTKNTGLSAYPIGSIYLTVNNTNPADLFGGTWAQLSNRFLVGAGSSYPAGSTGGGTAKDKIKIAGSHYTLADGTIVAGTGYSGQGLISITKNTSESAQTLTGNGITLDPAYLSVYMWKRTA